jgi:pyruvate dehydrogenase E2 component (dihydrolipoamide acetyltransferase)
VARPVRMPPLGETSDELRIVAWRKAVGDDVAVGEPLLEIETDKTTLEVEAAVAGTLLRIVHAATETVPAGTVIAYVGVPGEEVAEESSARPQRLFAAPAVRRFAEEQGVDLALVTGSGPDGRVERADVIAAITGGAAAATPASRHRRALAERLTRSTRIPQFSVGVTVDMTRAAAQVAVTPDLSYTHLLLQAVAFALREHPDINRLWLEQGPGFRSLERADVGLAVAAEETLLVVSIPEPDRLTPADLIETVERAAEGARAGRLLERHRTPVAVTLSNLGGIGVERFTALLDPDQTAVLAAGAVTARPALIDGQIRPAPQLDLTLTADHRVVDGATAGRFLISVRAALEAPG